MVVLTKDNVMQARYTNPEQDTISILFVDHDAEGKARANYEIFCQAGDQQHKELHAAGWDQSDEIHNSHSNPIENIYSNKSFRKGAEELIKLNLTFDAWHYHHQINDLTDFAKNYPELTIIHNHFGGPLGVGPYQNKRREIFKKWKDDVSLLSESKNVYAKLGGLAMPVNGWNFHKQDKPATSDQIIDMHYEYYLHTIECFGVDRCMFESNFPVDRRSVSYHVLWNAFKKMVFNYSGDDKNKLFFQNAKEVYGV